MNKVLKQRYEDIRNRVDSLNADCNLIVVSKGQTIEDIQTLYNCGARSFGESYFDDWEKKVGKLPDDIDWHFIGPMQSRKAKKHKSLLAKSGLIQSVDRSSLLPILDTLGTPVSNLVQVNLWGETQKGGKPANELLSFLEEIKNFENIKCLGLMAIPPYSDDREVTAGHFSQVRELYSSLKEEYSFSELSIGMSSDFEDAIRSGATMVRVGSAIFGGRA